MKSLTILLTAPLWVLAMLLLVFAMGVGLIYEYIHRNLPRRVCSLLTEDIDDLDPADDEKCT